jgi:hypothetical protein
VLSPDRADAPIYARLVQERGDIPAEVRQTAEQTWREVDRAMDFRNRHTSAAYR